MTEKGRRRTAPVMTRLRPELKQELQRLAEADRRTLASFVEGILEDYVAAKRAESGKPAGKRK